MVVCLPLVCKGGGREPREQNAHSKVGNSIIKEQVK